MSIANVTVIEGPLAEAYFAGLSQMQHCINTYEGCGGVGSRRGFLCHRCGARTPAYDRSDPWHLAARERRRWRNKAKAQRGHIRAIGGQAGFA